MGKRPLLTTCSAGTVCARVNGRIQLLRETYVSAPWIHFPMCYVFRTVGENVKEFFFRVAAMAFETNVLAELEKSGSRQIGDIVSE